MRHFKILSLAVLTLILPSATAQAETLTEKFSKTYPLAANGSLSLKNTNGNVTFEAWDRAEVQVNAEKKVKAGSAEDARKILSQIRIDVQAEPSAIHIETVMPKKGESGLWNMMFGGGDVNAGVTYSVKLPRGAIVEADNVNGGLRLTGTKGTGRLETTNGRIEVEGTSGALVLSSTNGGIAVRRAEGAVKASTTNGSIEAELARVSPDRDLGFSSTNGGVTVRLPRDARLSVDAATTNGGIHSDFELAGGESRKSHLTGDINGGGGTLRIRTTNGSVHISEI
jgi:DUF4097 and DUF4098 domain-containing protein YvlB